jgi:hypothetical protein
MRYTVQVLLKKFFVLEINSDEKLILAKNFQTEENLSDFAEKIEIFRKPGKNSPKMTKKHVLSYFGVHRSKL